MTIDINYESDLKLDIAYEDIIKDITVATLEHENCPYDVELSVSIVSIESMQSINLEYRGIDKPTDVLSFPLNEFYKPAYFADIRDRCDAFNPETGELMIGDIIVSATHIIKQADKYGHSRTRELAFLIVHSLLHLIGYDHIEDAGRIIMEERQRAILNFAGYTR